MKTYLPFLLVLVALVLLFFLARPSGTPQAPGINPAVAEAQG